MSLTRYLATNIVWETDGLDPEDLDLPTEERLDIEIFEGDTIVDCASDILWDMYGYDVVSLDIEEEEEPEEEYLREVKDEEYE